MHEETLHHTAEAPTEGFGNATLYEGVIAPVRTAQAAIKSSLSASVECDLLKFLCVQDYVPEKAQPSKVQQQQHPLPRKPTVASMQASDGSAVPGTLNILVFDTYSLLSDFISALLLL